MNRSIAVTVGDRRAAALNQAGQSADIGVGPRAGHRARGIAGDDGRAIVKPRQPADRDAAIRPSVYRYPGVAGADCAAVSAHQPAQIQTGRTGHRAARGVAGGNLAGAIAHQNAHHPPAAAHVGVNHPQIPDHPVSAQDIEQPGKAASVDGQVADGMPIAVKGGIVTPPDRIPIRESIRGSHRHAIGGEVQIRRQLIPGATHSAPHPRTRGRQIPAGERPGVGDIRAGGRRQPVAVQVMADGVQLVQRCHVNQPIVIPVIIRHHRPLRRRVQCRVLPGAGSEPPGVVREIILIQR